MVKICNLKSIFNLKEIFRANELSIDILIPFVQLRIKCIDWYNNSLEINLIKKQIVSLFSYYLSCWQSQDTLDFVGFPDTRCATFDR